MASLKTGSGADALAGLLAAARRAAAGERETAPLIDVPDRAVLKAMKKGSEEERRGLFLLLKPLPKRARAIAEQLLAQDQPSAVWSIARELLGGLEPPHLLVQADQNLEAALAGGPTVELARSFATLSPPLQRSWASLAAQRILDTDPALGSQLLGAEPTLGRLLAEAIAARGDAAAARWIETAASAAHDSAVAKALKAAAYRLAQAGQGVAMPEPARPALVAPSATRAFVTNVDGDGERAVWIAAPLPGGAFGVARALIGDTLGVRDFEWTETRRRTFEATLEEIRSRSGLAVIEVPVPHALGLVEESFFTQPAASSKDYAAYRGVEGVASRAALEPLALSLDEAEAAELARAPEPVLEHVYARSWRFDAPVAERAEAALESQKSPLVLPGHHSERRSQEVLAKLLDELDPAVARRFVRRLEETARLFLVAGEERLARTALASARQLAHNPLGSTPFALTLLERTLERRREARERRASERAAEAPAP